VLYYFNGNPQVEHEANLKNKIYIYIYHALDISKIDHMHAYIVSYPVFMSKSSINRMHHPGSIVLHIQLKVFTDNQMSRIKYNYYISNVSKGYDNSQQNSGRLHNSTGITTGATRSLELLVKEFQSIFSF
jgi:hypothetical protein